jgi:IclR family pca regulon transcriptional regulator
VIRTRAFAIAREEHELGVLALAVPLRNMKGSTLAALNVVVSPSRMTEGELRRDLLGLLQEAARELRLLL